MLFIARSEQAARKKIIILLLFRVIHFAHPKAIKTGIFFGNFLKI